MSMSFVTSFGAGLCSLLLATTVAEAAGRGRLFEKLDQDGDGRISRAEFTAGTGHWIERVDGDGAVSREEWRVAAERHKRKPPKESVE